MENHPKFPLAGRGVTLNKLKDERHSLNMRLLLAMQNHDEKAQKDLREQLAEVQKEMDRMCSGGGPRN